MDSRARVYAVDFTLAEYFSLTWEELTRNITLTDQKLELEDFIETLEDEVDSSEDVPDKVGAGRHLLRTAARVRTGSFYLVNEEEEITGDLLEQLRRQVLYACNYILNIFFRSVTAKGE